MADNSTAVSAYRGDTLTAIYAFWRERIWAPKIHFLFMEQHEGFATFPLTFFSPRMVFICMIEVLWGVSFGGKWVDWCFLFCFVSLTVAV